jgi:hypothetical protein
MKKLVLIPTVVITAFLSLAFLMPATASGIVRTNPQGTSTQSTTTPQMAGRDAMVDPASHEVSTAGHSNCGRFGNGFHGGKHDFTCPNRPFPAPASGF